MFIHEHVGQSDFHERFDWFAFKMPMKTEQRGFTLIEVLIAITILAFVILSMFAIYVHVIRELRRAKNRTYAMQAIAMMAERIIGNSHDARRFNNANTDDLSTSDSEIYEDVRAWQAILREFPGRAVGTVTTRIEPRCRNAQTPPLCARVVIVNVVVQYRNYGHEASHTATIYLEPKEQLD